MFNHLVLAASAVLFIGEAAIKSVPIMINDANQAICNKMFK